MMSHRAMIAEAIEHLAKAIGHERTIGTPGRCTPTDPIVRALMLLATAYPKAWEYVERKRQENPEHFCTG